MGGVAILHPTTGAAQDLLGGILSATPAGAALIGGVALSASTSPVTGSPALSQYLGTATASTNAALILTGARRLLGGQLQNVSASTRFVKFFNKPTAPIPGTDTPTLTVILPAASMVFLAQVLNVYGQQFPLGLGIAITGGLATNDATVIAAGDVIVAALYL